MDADGMKDSREDGLRMMSSTIMHGALIFFPGAPKAAARRSMVSGDEHVAIFFCW